METLTSFFTSLMIMSAAVVVLSEYATKFTKAEGGWARAQSWIISILLGIGGSWIDLGIFDGVEWGGGALIGAISALMANGIFTIDLIKTLLEKIGARVSSMKK